MADQTKKKNNGTMNEENEIMIMGMKEDRKTLHT